MIDNVCQGLFQNPFDEVAFMEAKDASGPHASYGRKKKTRPIASKMCSLALHPGLYRTDCVGDLGGARAFAEALGVSQRIPDFVERVWMAISERFVKRLLRRWAALPSHILQWQ